MKVLIVSGFLGAGKTTFIQKMVRATKRDYVIVENEFAEWSIDAAQLQANDDTRLDVWELTEGCVCCNQKGRFTDSLLTISNTLNPEYLIVEPSGVASLQAVCHSVSTVAYERICLLPPITLVDAQQFFNQAQRYPELMRDQVQHAGVLQLSKTTACSATDIARLCEVLRRWNPQAPVMIEEPQQQVAAYWQRLLTGEWHSVATPMESVTEMRQVSVAQARCPHVGTLIQFLEYVVHGVFGTVARAKGVFLVQRALALRFDVVGPQYAITLAEQMAGNQAVFIGPQLNEPLLRQVLKEMGCVDLLFRVATEQPQ